MSSRKITFDVRPPNIRNGCKLYNREFGTRAIRDSVAQDIISEIKNSIPENKYTLLSNSLSTEIGTLNSTIRLKDMMKEYFEPTPITTSNNESIQYLDCDTLYLAMDDEEYQDNRFFLFKFVWVSLEPPPFSWDSAYLLCVYLELKPKIEDEEGDCVIRRASSLTITNNDDNKRRRITGKVLASDVIEDWFGREKIFATKEQMGQFRTLNFSSRGWLNE